MLVFNKKTALYYSVKVILFFLLLSFVRLGRGKTVPEIKKIRKDVYTRFTDFSLVMGDKCGTITDIEEDKFGYIWLAGTKCLSRYDGNNIKHYINDWMPGSLPSSIIYCIEPDFYGRLWIGTGNGLCFYDYDKDNFVRVFGPDTNKIPSDTFCIRNVYTDGDSLLWMDTQQGYLWKINSRNLKVIKKYRHPFTTQPYYYYNPVIRDNDGDIWLGGRGQGPFLLKEEENRVSVLPSSHYEEIPGKKRGYDVAYFHHDSLGNLWVGSSDGIYLFDKKNSKYELFYKSSSWAFLEDHEGDYWFGVANGLGRFHPQSGEMTLYIPNEEDVRSLLGSYIFDIFEDSYHQVWIATAKGVSVYKRESPGVQYLFHIPGISESPASSFVSALVQDNEGKIWIGTTGNGIDRYDLGNKEVVHFNSKNTKGLPSDKIRCITLDSSGAIYAGLWAGKGFGKLQPDKRRFSLYTFSKVNSNVDWYNDLVFDAFGNLYLGFRGSIGLTLFNPATEKFERNLRYKFSIPELSRLISCTEMDKHGHLWVGTTMTGLHMLIPGKDTAISFYAQVNPQVGINERKIFALQQDDSGNIWVGAKGLYHITVDTPQVEVVLSEKMNGTDIFGLLPENEFTVWLLTSKGLLKYNHTNKSITDYSYTVKLSFQEDNASGLKLNDGRLMFGGKNGIAIVDPEKIKLGSEKPSVFLSSVLVFDKVKTPNLENHKVVRLNYKENFFTIRIGSNVWGEGNPFRFYYKLENFNKGWVEMSAFEREAHFTNVPPGEYLFRVKVEDRQGNKYVDVATCMVYINPPYWLRWWFVSLVSLAFLSVLVNIWWFRTKSYRLLLFNSELNQKLLRLQMNPHFIFNSLFAIQKFIYSNQPHLAGNYFSDFAHLVRLILDNSRKEFISIENELESIGFYLKLQKLRFEDRFDYHIEVDPLLKSGYYQIPPMLAQPFLENAIEHGIKKLHKKGKIIVKYQLSDDKIHFTVIDNGIGLSASRNLNDNQKHKKESLAISICRKRLEMLHKKKGVSIYFSLEEIKNEDGSVAGTKVSFSIPV